MSWLQIKNNAAGDIDELYIYGEIGDWWEYLDAASLAEKIKNSKGDKIRVRVNSGGGSVFTALSAYSLLKTSGKQIEVFVDGICASAATFFLCAANKVTMTLGGQIMIHNPLTAVYGNAEELRKTAEILDQVGGSIAMLYAEKTGKDIQDIQEKMDAETWFDANQAKEYGFISDILETQQMAANTKAVIEMSAHRLKNMPKKAKGEGKVMNLSDFKSQHAPVAEEFKNEIIKAERERIKDIQSAAGSTHAALAAQAIDNGWDAGKFALEALKADKAAGEKHIQDVKDDAKPLDNVPDVPPVIENTFDSAFEKA